MVSVENKHDLNFVVFYVLIGVFVLLTLNVVNTNTSLTFAVSVYTNIFYTSIVLIIMGIVLGKENQYFGMTFFGEEANPAKNEGKLLIGLLLGAVIGFFIVTQFFTLFNINFIPQSLIETQDASTIFFLLFVGPIAESVLFVAILIPTFRKILKNFTYGLSFILVFFAVVILGLTTFYSIAFLLVIAGVIFIIFNPSNYLKTHEGITTFIAVTLASVAFGIYHSKAYSTTSNPQSNIFGAMLFNFVCGYLMVFTGTSMSAIMTHVVANAVTYLQTSPSSWLIVLLIVIAFPVLVLLAYGFTKKIKFQNPVSAIKIGN